MTHTRWRVQAVYEEPAPPSREHGFPLPAAHLVTVIVANSEHAIGIDEMRADLIRFIQYMARFDIVDRLAEYACANLHAAIDQAVTLGWLVPADD